MAAACLMVAGQQLALAAGVFTLSWTHSVEKTIWHETWQVAAHGLTLTESRLKGSGAGMEPGPDARLIGGWWVSRHDLAVPSIALSNSGATGSNWQLCADGICRELGAGLPQPVVLQPCGGGHG